MFFLTSLLDCPIDALDLLPIKYWLFPSESENGWDTKHRWRDSEDEHFFRCTGRGEKGMGTNAILVGLSKYQAGEGRPQLKASITS